MANLLIGSSNVYRNFTRSLDKGCFSGLSLQLVQCTRKAAFDANLVTVTEASFIVTSVLENFIVDACAGVKEDAVQLFAHQQITAHVEDLFNLTARLPDVNIMIVPPIFRSNPAWFGPYLPDFISFLSSEIGRFGSPRMSVCSPFLVTPALLEQDGIHLTAAGGDRFMSHLDAALSTFATDADAEAPDVMDLDTTVVPASASDRLTQILEAVNRNASQLESIGMIGDNVTSLARKTADFESFVRRRFRNDDFIFARMKEESDADVNRSREDRVVITGLASPGAAVTTHVEKKQHYKDVVTRLISLACTSVDPLPQVALINIVYLHHQTHC
jgi:hypothetical protein